MTELNFKGKEFVYNHHLVVPFRPQPGWSSSRSILRTLSSLSLNFIVICETSYRGLRKATV